MLLAIDIGGTKLAVGAATRDEFAATGRLTTLVKELIPAPGDPETVIARIVEIATSMNAPGGFESIGISIGGPLDHRTGTVINFPHLPGWQWIPLSDRLSFQLGAPARLDNDANLGALAEHRLGAGRGVSDMVYLTLSTGIGGGVIVDSALVHGVRSSAAEVGHITVQTDGPKCACGNPGCLERMASGTNIARAAREALAAAEQSDAANVELSKPGAVQSGSMQLGLAGATQADIERAKAVQSNPGMLLHELYKRDPNALTAEHVAIAAAGGDAIAMRVWDRSMEYIAIGLGSIIHVLAPSLIVLGGGVSQAGDLLLEPVRRHLRKHVFYVPLDEIRVELAQLGHDSAVLGAAVLATMK
ncbi:MAG: ROK family protein [bacterium]|nr:ROK family protein [Candidatus Kapabacteria bacterium]